MRRAFAIPTGLRRRALLLGALILAMLALMLALILTLSALGGDNEAGAASLSRDPQNPCTTANCNAQIIQGQTLASALGASPFTTEVYSAGGECLRLDVTAQDTDLAMVVVSPSFSQVYRNDDTVGLRPQIRIDPTGSAGWYTVHLNHFAGAAVNASFTLRYGLYPSGNPNCASPTPPLAAASLSAESAESSK
jgi:hypothetical protein